MSLVDSPAETIPSFLDGVTCDGFRAHAQEPVEKDALSSAILPREMEYFGKEAGEPSLLCDDLMSCPEDAAGHHVSGHSAKEMVFGVGWALVLHVSLALAVLLLPIAGLLPPAESQFITVSLVGSGGTGESGGEGAGGAPDGPGGSTTGSPARSTVSIPAPDRAAGFRPEIPETEPQWVLPPEEAAFSPVVVPPPEKPVVNEKPPPRIVPKPQKKQAVCSPKPKPRKDPDARADAKIESPSIPTEAPVPGKGAADGIPGGRECGDGGSVGGTGGGAGDGTGGGGLVGGTGRGTGGMPGEFTLKQVEHPPVVLHKVEPHFPEAARRMGVTGKVVAKFLVRADGHVSRASILEVQPPGHFEQCVLDALDKWEFKPGTYRGKPVATWVVQAIHFKLTR